MKNKTLPVTIAIAVVVGISVGSLITPLFALESPLAAFAVSTLITVALLASIEGIAGSLRTRKTERVPLGELQGLYVVSKREIPKATEVLTAAFKDDPLFTRLFGNAEERSQKYSKVANMMLRHCFTYGAVYASSEHFEGIIAVTQDRHTYITTWQLIRSGGIVPFLGIGLRSLMKVAGSLTPMDGVRRNRMKNRAYAYINVIGVAPEYQGKGYGGKMLRSMLKASDEAKLPTYLETETESNVALYERFGFTTCMQMKLPIIDQPMWTMIRESGH